MKLSQKTFYNKVLGCFMGKNIGGTLGAPVEWQRQINDFTFYTHNLNGEPLPNDDLDLQLIWLKCVEDCGIHITARELAEYWLDYEVANYAEYGIGKSNLKAGFEPPLSGILGNEFKDSCGAYIRSEIWACMCPGRPDLAVQYAYEDAIVDHGNGEGTYAALFSAAMEAAAFAESDFRKLIEIGKSYIPSDCGVAKAIDTATECYEKGIDWKECRDTILERHRGCCPFHNLKACSERDRKKGLHTGKLGYDVPSNIGILVAGMLYGEGNFDKTLCTTVNMGEDTDCTAGTVGALFGIIYGIEKIPERWIQPIGHSIQTICCNKAHGQFFPQTVEELSERIIKQAKIVSLSLDGKDGLKTMDIFGDTDDLSELDSSQLYAQNIYYLERVNILRPFKGPRYDHPLFSAALEYETGILETQGETKVTLLLSPKNWDDPFNLSVEWISDDFTVAPQNKYLIPMWSRLIRHEEKITFTLSSEQSLPKYEGIIKLTIPGRHTKIFIPVTLQGFDRKPHDEATNHWHQ